MFWDWLYRILYWRQIRDDLREIDEMSASWDRMSADTDRRIREVFTPEDWAATRERCESLQKWATGTEEACG